MVHFDKPRDTWFRKNANIYTFPFFHNFSNMTATVHGWTSPCTDIKDVSDSVTHGTTCDHVEKKYVNVIEKRKENGGPYIFRLKIWPTCSELLIPIRICFNLFYLVRGVSFMRFKLSYFVSENCLCFLLYVYYLALLSQRQSPSSPQPVCLIGESRTVGQVSIII